jgi:nucleotide-binding universal stress UspA family protein
LQAAEAKVAVEHRLVAGESAAEILRATEEIDPDLIVMGTRGRTAAERSAFGSVADRVLRQAPCPVVMVNTATTPPPAAKACESNTVRKVN